MPMHQLDLSSPARAQQGLIKLLREWSDFGRQTECDTYNGVPVFCNEFWTHKQRAAHSLHEISYRACFKPQLPRFFIERLTKPGDLVFDPFMGRGTTLLEASLMGRDLLGNDVNPLSARLLSPRLSPPRLDDIQARLLTIEWEKPIKTPADFEVFFEARTLRQICNLRAYLHARRKSGAIDDIDGWIEMIALNRLTGHSRGFFSVYTLPPNQATSLERQRKINETRDQTPQYRDVAALILRKSRSLLRDMARQAPSGQGLKLFSQSVELSFDWPEAKKIALSVTSPPFLNTVNYRQDNWMRCWFAGIDADSIQITQTAKLATWQHLVSQALANVAAITQPGGWFAFEVGEVKKGTLSLDKEVVNIAKNSAWTPCCIMVNRQAFTKTSQTWGVDNNRGGTNSNRIVLLQRA